MVEEAEEFAEEVELKKDAVEREKLQVESKKYQVLRCGKILPLYVTKHHIVIIYQRAFGIKSTRTSCISCCD